MKYCAPIIMFCVVSFSSFAQNVKVGVFQDHQDVGSPKNPGSVSYDSVAQSYILRGSGYNIWFGRDEFHFAYKKLKGDFVVTANFEFVGQGTELHRKIGWMIRQSTDDNSPHYTATVHGDGLTSLQWRSIKGAYMRDPDDQLASPKKGFTVLQLERKGREVIMRAAHKGEPLQVIGSTFMDAKLDEVLVGLFICSHNPDVTEEARVWNVRIDKPVPFVYNAYQQGFMGSRLEIMNVFDGKRKVVHESNGRFEAPNWMPDGKRLLFNEGGSIYIIPVVGGMTEKLNTGIADHNNNDHGISFDGKMLAISHQRSGMTGNGSTVYVLPLTGGEPRLLTEKTPSYWHSWSPNGKEVLFAGQRDDKFDIYKMPVAGGKEIPLTHSKGLQDGPEYAPDGKHIYYNSNESGTMQIWRMKPDGTGNEQVTFDQYNNWFPHISPDGKWMVFISFPEEINVNDHPFYKAVTLRLMPASGGAPMVIAYLLGGQGTINVPSWSPDSKSIAFVSNSEKF